MEKKGRREIYICTVKLKTWPSPPCCNQGVLLGAHNRQESRLWRRGGGGGRKGFKEGGEGGGSKGGGGL